MVRRFWWLKRYRLHKYAPLFCSRSRAHMRALDTDSLLQLGLTNGASKKLLLKLDPALRGAGPPWPKDDSEEEEEGTGVVCRDDEDVGVTE